MAEDKVSDNKKLVLIGGSAGSLPVILKNIGSLDVSLPFAMILVLHRMPTGENLLEELLATRTDLIVKEAEDKEAIVNGTVYIAPADYHLLIEKEHTLALDYSERQNYSRPSIDATFETAAAVYGNNALAILVSGANADGVEGLKTIQSHGGITAAQSPALAQVAYMPQQAIKEGAIHHVLNDEDIMPFINQWVQS